MNKAEVLQYMAKDHTISVLRASEHFKCTPQDIHDIINQKDKKDEEPNR